MPKSKVYNLIFSVSLISVFIIGLIIHKDFGISLDEVEYRFQGFIILNHIGEILFPDLLEKFKDGRSYPSVAEYQSHALLSGIPYHAFSSLLELILNFDDKSQIFYFKHLTTFILFLISAVYFYKLLLFRFESKPISYLGFIFLILSNKHMRQPF